MPSTASKEVLREREDVAEYRRQGVSFAKIAKKMGLSGDAVKRRWEGHKRNLDLDPQIAGRLEDIGLSDFRGLSHGWLIQKDEHGQGASLFFKMPGGEQVNAVDAIKEALSDIEPLPPIAPPSEPAPPDLANAIAAADFHIGADYGRGNFEGAVKAATDTLFSRLQPAQKLFIVELGDLLDANDHKGLTPGAGNPLDVDRHALLSSTQIAIGILDHMIRRGLETHAEVQVDLVRGNHDETSYIAVMIGLGERYAENPRVNIVVTDDVFRVLRWGDNGILPHHGDKGMTWPKLKDIWTDQFPNHWADCRADRRIWTAHYHTLKSQDLLGAECEQFRTPAQPSKWARSKAYFSKGMIAGYTFDKTEGEVFRARSRVRFNYPDLTDLEFVSSRA